MADIQNLIKTILTNTKLADNDFIVSKIYRDEPVLRTAAQMADFLPLKYREMRKLAKGAPIYYESDSKIFYEQGKFMEDFTDDYRFEGEFLRYYPTYQSMTDRQLRGYFSWRTRVREGIIEKTSLSFVFVYIYELLNQIGVKSPEEGFYTLKKFWYEYQAIDPKINHYLKLWLKDYIIYYGLEKSHLDDFTDVNAGSAVSVLKNIRSHNVDEVFTAINSLSSYNLENSRFFKLHSDDMKTVVYKVFEELPEKLSGQTVTNQYAMFNAAVFYSPQRHRDCVYEINDACRYICKNGRWTCETVLFLKESSRHIGEILKTIDFLMRHKYGFKSTLKAEKLDNACKDLILEKIDRLLEEKRRKAAPKIEIDVTKLNSIRVNALETQKRLIVEDSESEACFAAKLEEKPEGEREPDPESEPIARHEYGEAAESRCFNFNLSATDGVYHAGTANPINILSSAEYEFTKCLLQGKDYNDLIKTNGLMLSVLIDSINEKLFELFNDTVLIFNDDKPVPVEDYKDELRELAGG